MSNRGQAFLGVHRVSKSKVAGYITRRHVGSTQEEGEALYRQEGATRALYWLARGFNLEVLEELASAMPASSRFVDGAGKPERMTKLTLALRVDKAITELQEAHKLDPNNGWNQVKGKGLAANRAYGHMDELDRLMQEFDLWAVVPTGM